MGHLKHSVHINAPVDKIDEFTEHPNNWPTFMVGMSDINATTERSEVGSEVSFTVVMAGVHLHQSVRTVENRDDPEGGGHWRGEFTGGQSGWMTMDFKPDDGGTLVIQEMEYTVPGSLLGRVADRLVIERMQERDMLHSLENLRLLMEETPA